MNSVFPIFSSIALFAFIAYKSSDLSIAAFLAFNAAFGQFLAAAAGNERGLRHVDDRFPAV